MLPRAVLVERPTEYTSCSRATARASRRASSSTRATARSTRSRAATARWRRPARRVLGAIPPDWRRAAVQRADLDRFLFEPEDVVVVLGPGRARRQRRQVPRRPAGDRPQPRARRCSCRHLAGARRPTCCADVAAGPRGARGAHDGGRAARRRPGAARAQRGLRRPRSHQSARYTLAVGERAERQSSSGLIVATGTGATGWAASIHRERHSALRAARARRSRAAPSSCASRGRARRTGTDADRGPARAPARALERARAR